MHRPLLLTGAAIASLGTAAILAPLYWAGSLLWLAGLFVLGSASLTILQFLWGWARGRRVRISLMFALGVLLELTVGALLMSETRVAIRLLALTVGLALVLEAAAQAFFSRHLDHRLSQIGLLLQAALTGGLGIAAFWYLGSEKVEAIVIVALGVKLLLFGVALVQISFHKATDIEKRFVFGAQQPNVVKETPGEVYAVFLGGGYHVGVYVGNGEVVDLLRELDSSRLTTWEDFLLGRDPEHWTYPDLPQVSTEEVVRVARESIGKNMPYNFLEFNCEHFSIYCKSGGTTTYSKYAQLSLCHEAISKRPLLGSAIELQARVVGAITHAFGGEFGKHASLRIRRASAFVTNRLLAAYLGQDLESAAAESDKAFESSQDSAAGA
ncbi:MAG: lecithin retinol acyltransferase family protein [Planctomycetota bacterium]